MREGAAVLATVGMTQGGRADKEEEGFFAHRAREGAAVLTALGPAEAFGMPNARMTDKRDSSSETPPAKKPAGRRNDGRRGLGMTGGGQAGQKEEGFLVADSPISGVRKPDLGMRERGQNRGGIARYARNDRKEGFLVADSSRHQDRRAGAMTGGGRSE